MKSNTFLSLLAFSTMLFTGCSLIGEEEEEITVKPTVEIVSVESVKMDRVLLKCKLVSDGSSPVNILGVCYNAIPNPTIEDNKVMSTTLKNEFEVEVTGLMNQKSYYFKAYASSKAGLSYSEEIKVTTRHDSTSNAIGKTGPGGGIVFYDKGFVSEGWRYMEVTPGNNNSFDAWGCDNQHVYTLPGLGYGLFNTNNFVDKCSQGAAASSNLMTTNGMEDWFLPSIDELELMYQNLHKNGLGGFIPSEYWSSTEAQNPNIMLTHALSIDFRNGNIKEERKDIEHIFRVVRRFSTL